MAKVSNKKICSLCELKTLKFRETLYNALICQKCHSLLMTYGVKSKEDVDKMVKDKENRLGKYLEDIRKNFSSQEPVNMIDLFRFEKAHYISVGSETMREIKNKTDRRGTLVFFITLCTIWFITIFRSIKISSTDLLQVLLYLNMFPFIPIFLSNKVKILYFKLVVRQKQNLIR